MTQQEFLERIRTENQLNYFDGNLSATTETIFYSKPLIVEGDIESGVSLIVEGDLTVKGTVFDAAVTSTGCVMITESFIGAGKGKLVSGLSVTVKAINGQSIVAKGSVTIGVEALNADIRAYETIDAHTARIVGGKTEASHEILVRDLGSDDSRQTKVYLGNRKKLLQRINEILSEEKSLNDRLPKINKCIYRWNRIKVDGVMLTGEQETMLAKLRTMRDSFPRQADLFRKEVDQLNCLLKDKIESTLVVRGSLYENVLVDINGIKEVTDRTYQNIRFHMGAQTLVKLPA